jgi:predicted metal-dependent phosphoesterase TrpH
MVNIDFHVHSSASYDCETELSDIVHYAKRNNINVVCITDHSKMEIQTHFFDEVLLVAGEEVLSNEGEITGLYMKEEIPPGLSALETINRIKAQGGLVYIPHPFDVYRKGSIRYKVLKKIVDHVDIVEAGNSKSLTSFEFYMARHFANKHQKFISAGSDGHIAKDVGSSYVSFTSDLIPDSAETMIQVFNQDKRLFVNRKRLLPRVLKKLKNGVC